MTRTASGLVWRTCLGNLFEHYDTALFGFLSPCLAQLIFPQHDPITALILTYAILPLGMLARPIGAIAFGYIGDTYGRERSLFYTFGGMALVSGCIGLIPTYTHIGILAPILFCLGRVLQNVFAGGETMGGAIVILEKAPKKQKNMLSSLYNASTMGGHLLASWGVYIITLYEFINPGWRMLYLCGSITALIGCYFRKCGSHHSSSVSQGYSHRLFEHRKALVAIILCSGFAHATYSIALVLMNGLLPLITSLTQAEVMKINTSLLVLDFCALPVFGWVANKISREILMLTISLSTVILSIPLMIALEGATLATIVGIRSVLVIIGVAFFAPFHAWAEKLVPSECRYTIISFGYAIGTQLLGSPTASISLWCFKSTGMVVSIAWYWMFLAITSSLAIMIMVKVSNTKKASDLLIPHLSVESFFT